MIGASLRVGLAGVDVGLPGADGGQRVLRVLAALTGSDEVAAGSIVILEEQIGGAARPGGAGGQRGFAQPPSSRWGGVAWPYSSSPQQVMEPSTLIAQAVS